MNCLVTGAAGFIGSHLCEELLNNGHRVVGIDAFTDNYDPAIKRHNLAGFASHPGFRLLESDLTFADCWQSVGAVDWLFHLAARPGVRTSWGDDFSVYCEHNILATQRLLEACLELQPQKIIFASSSSVYGNARRLPVKETSPVRPISPYGATKLAGEHLCRIYWTNHHLPICMLRYFTVYGPRQRPDMAFSRWIKALLDDEPIRLFGDGRQMRDFTFVSDAVRATILAAERGAPGDIYNIAGGAHVSVGDVLSLLAETTGRTPQVHREARQKGDARNTWADTSSARQALGFVPQVTLKEGLKAQFEAAVFHSSSKR
ncbi:MAG: NAD-dependent epimerase/dehydratase family protein [Armatimonadetes bacterium]|nr:NAD-dependent epimerase/dehydratase family protein [Armatimonadota bacterium]NIO76441.1 NAD-dependent epimerase/dehydratase family protein [Armatimonadota bacterium]NIO98161.1 NAD-dependent epimerase/dehydratase family protein [Armatimonadota bacterium]